MPYCTDRHTFAAQITRQCKYVINCILLLAYLRRKPNNHKRERDRTERGLYGVWMRAVCVLVFSLVNTAEQFCGVNFTSTTYSVDASHTETQSTLYLWYLCFCNLFVGRLDITYRNEFVLFINRFNSLKVYITRPN